ncbi:hypothetical protein C6P45_001224 [Maudiozyma exigua]|uniref:DNA-binding protein REB1 n=1 Tax=Maudiozyma exigua TaxID=34358 RepID=A0A9P7B693_MAUEX|nr:hypothetical protein C6P45_001224 [Kazachstania exigua]
MTQRSGNNDDGGSNAQSVEEAVLEYVGGRFPQDDLRKMASDRDNDSNGNGLGDQNIKNHGDENGTAPSNNDDMSWYLKHDEDINQDEHTGNDIDANGGDNPESVAMAAVVAAYASSSSSATGTSKSSKRKHKKSHGDKESSKKHKKQKKQKKSSKNKSSKKSDEIEEETTEVQAIAVDPELATLDNDEGSENANLQSNESSNKDINGLNITQNQDFQQYLNTDIPIKEESSKKEPTADTSKKSKKKKRSNESEESNTLTDIVPVSEEMDSNKDNNLEKSPLKNPLEAPDHTIVSMRADKDTLLLSDAAKNASSLIRDSSQGTGKAFDEMEEKALERFIDEYRIIKGFTRKETCERIWTNGRRKDDFWINICKVLPYRTRSSIYKHVRRKYHIFEQRGKWTKEEDAELAKLCIDKEGQWSEIGRIIGRMPEDCRDRFRNYIKCGSNRASNKWTKEEEEKLKYVIGKLIYLDTADGDDYPEFVPDKVDEDGLEVVSSLPQIPKSDSNTRSFNDIINWTVVSECMLGTRSRIQCRYKWNKLVRKEAMSRIQGISESTKKWTLEKLRDLGFTDDSQVDWEELATLCPDPQWSGLELKLSYEKMRTSIKGHKSKNINDITKELLAIIEGTNNNKKGSRNDSKEN